MSEGHKTQDINKEQTKIACITWKAQELGIARLKSRELNESL